MSCHAIYQQENWKEIQNQKTASTGRQTARLVLCCKKPNWFNPLQKGPRGLLSKVVFHQSHQQRNHRPIQLHRQILPKKTRAVRTRDLLQLFIEVDKIDDSAVKNKAVSAIRNQLESALEQAVEVIDLDATTNNFDDVTASPKVPSLWRAMDEAIAVPIARPTLASESPTPTGTTTEQVVLASTNPVK